MSTILEKISPATLKLIEDQARSLSISPDEFLRGLLTANGQELALGPDASDDEFEADMVEFAEGTEHLAPHMGSYNRDEIYFDHD